MRQWIVMYTPENERYGTVAESFQDEAWARKRIAELTEFHIENIRLAHIDRLWVQEMNPAMREIKL